MIFILVHLKLSPQQARRLYRRRFGIETSYRCARQVRGWTTSNNPVYRFLLMALSFLLLNVWLYLRMLVARLPQGGQPVLNTTYFQFGRFIKFLIRALEQRYGCIHELPALSPNTEELARI
jgi:putative transposase